VSADTSVRVSRTEGLRSGDGSTHGTGARRGDGIALAILAAIAYVPLFLSHRGRVVADIKQYLYLDPGGLLGSAAKIWNPRYSGGTVTHQNIGYLWPTGPYYWLTDALGIPTWVAQRFWFGSILFAAAAGAYVLFRVLWRDQVAATVGALVYGLSPFVIGHITGQSALLLPFSALPWLILAARNSLRGDNWRWPALFALVTTTAGSLNGSSIFFVLCGALLWIPYAVWWERSATLREGVAAILRIGLLTVLMQLWWLMAYRVGGIYGLPVLQVTETVRETAAATSAVEIFRGLGYRFFYGSDNQGPYLPGLATSLTRSIPVLAVSFAAPLACVVGGWWSRFRERAFFVALVVGGLLMSTIAFPEPHRSPVGSVFESMSRHSGLVLSLRNTQRAASLVVLGLAGLGTAALVALRRRRPRAGLGAGLALLGVVVLTFAHPWASALVPDRFDRPEAIPQPWVDAGHYLDRVGGRAMLVPGIDFAAYRWGNTLDPVLAGLTHTDLVWRELLPMGGEPGADLVAAFDESIQENTFDPRTVVPVARALGVTHIVVANDLQYERYHTQRPEIVMQHLLDPAAGLELVATFGDGYVNQNFGAPIVDPTELRAQYTSATPLPEVAIFKVPGASADPVTTYAAGHETVLHGDGAGVLAAAAAGLLDPAHAPLLSGSSLATWPAARRAVRGPNARQIVTDTNRKEVRRFQSLLEATGATQAADGSPDSGIPEDVDASDFTLSKQRDQSIVQLAGAKSIDASAYGNVVSLFPEDRPDNAFDGDPRTSWRVDVPRFRDLLPSSDQFLRIDVGHRVRADHVDVVQPRNRPGTQAITSFDVVLDGTRVFPVTVDPAQAFAPEGTRVTLDGKPFSTLEVRIPDTGYDGPVGIGEVVIPGVHVEEVVRLPRSLDALGRVSSPIPLAYVLTRLRADPSEAYRQDPELSMHREFDVPTAMTFALSGTARVNSRAADDVIDRVLGTTPPGVTVSSTEYLTGDAAARASAAVDGDPTTAWTTPFVGVTGQQWRAHFDNGFQITELPIDIAVDAEHSLPTKLGITVDGVTHEFAVPPLRADAGPGTVTRVTYTPDQPLVGHDLSIEILEVTPRFGADIGGVPRMLPVGLAEIGIGATPLASTPASMPSPCRTDLLTIDGNPVGVRISGEAGPAVDQRLAIATCDGAPIALNAGRHVIRTAPGLTTGIDLDQLALVSPEFTAAPGADAVPSVVSSSRNQATIAPTDDPYWLRLDQSYNRGWKATAHTADGKADLGTSHPIDAFASGWHVEGTGAVTRVDFTWTPQRAVYLALLVSGLAVFVCLALIAFRRRRRDDSSSEPPLLAAYPLRVPAAHIALSIVVVVAGTLFGSPVIGAGLLVFAVGATLAPRFRALAAVVSVVPLVALFLAVASVILKQNDHDFPHDQFWPSHFGTAHELVLFGLLAYALVAWSERAEDLEAGATDSEPTGP
jgi:arabinofuranan 3-O-arabinosyltransferase